MNEKKSEKLEWAMTEYGESLIRLAFTYVKDIHKAEDIIQDVFLKVYANLHQFKGKSSFKTYLYRITINQCKDYLKSWSFKNLFFTEKSIEYSFDSFESTVIRFEENYELGMKILDLPIKYREVIILYYYQDYSISEIATLLTVSESTIHTRLRRAKQRLKEKIFIGAGENLE